MLVAAAAGGLFAAGHGEPGQDLTLARPRLRAEPAGGGCYRLSGRQAFAALPPGWTRLGVHALDDSDPAHPQVVHAFLRRDTPGYRIIEAPASGQPASPAARSEPGSAQAASGQPGRLLVSLDRAVARAARVLPAGPPGAVLGCLLSWMLLSTANISYATGQRAFDQAAQAARQSPLSERGPSSEQGPSSDWTVAEAALELGAIESQLDRLARSRPRPGLRLCGLDPAPVRRPAPRRPVCPPPHRPGRPGRQCPRGGRIRWITPRRRPMRRPAGQDGGMLDHVSIQCADVAASAAFYDAVLAPLGGGRVMDFGQVIGYGTAAMPDFWLGPQSTGHGFRESHLAFTAPTRDAVRRSSRRQPKLARRSCTNRGCGRSTTPATTAPLPAIRTGTTSKPYATPRADRPPKDISNDKVASRDSPKPLAQPRVAARNAAQAARLKTSAGPSGSLESRTATIPGRFRATWTHWPPLPPLRVLVRHTAVDRSAPGQGHPASPMSRPRGRCRGLRRAGGRNHCIAPDLVHPPGTGCR